MLTFLTDVGADVRAPLPDSSWMAGSAGDLGRLDEHMTLERSFSSSSHYSDCKSDVGSDDNDYEYEDDYYKDKVSMCGAGRCRYG